MFLRELMLEKRLKEEGIQSGGGRKGGFWHFVGSLRDKNDLWEDLLLVGVQTADQKDLASCTCVVLMLFNTYWWIVDW